MTLFSGLNTIRICNLGRVFGSKSFSSDFHIWNALVKEKCELKLGDSLSWYSCGPTVYDSAHIGHASAYIRQDVVRRVLEKHLGNVSLVQVMGVTNIDDKIIKRAKEGLSGKYEEEFFADLALLNVKSPHVKARVSDFIPNIVFFITDLLKKNIAYVAPEGSVYFDTEKYGKYGKFRNSDNDLTFEPNKEKRNHKDFVLWKSWKPGEPFWTSPWGNGRPGWHIECSAIASHYFGSTLDIHSGGTDLIFPHHENEEAQCCGRFGSSQWVTHWIHTGHLYPRGDEEKMSKSLGNTTTIQQFLTKHSPNDLRILCLMSNYRSNIEYSEKSLENAKRFLRELRGFPIEMDEILTGKVQVSFSAALWDLLQDTKKLMEMAFKDDFDVSTALDHLTHFVKEVNRAKVVGPPGPNKQPPDFQFLLASKVLMEDFLHMVGIREATGTTELLDPVLDQLNSLREDVRNFALANNEEDERERKRKRKERSCLMTKCDQVREDLGLIGINVKDHQAKSSWSFNK